MNHFNLRCTLYAAASLIIIVASKGCQKNPIPQPSNSHPVHLLEIIDWEDSTSVPGTIPQYTVEYSSNRIIALHGRYGDSIWFNYEANSGSFPDSLGIPGGSRIIRGNNLLAAQGSIAVDTFYFKDDKYNQFRSLALGDSSQHSSMFTQFLGLSDSSSPRHKTFIGNSDYAGFTSLISVDYDSDDDIVKIRKTAFYGGYTLTFNVEVQYSGRRNNLHAIDPNFSLYDPSCRGAAAYTMIAPDQHVSAFPFSIHYSSKCVSSYKIESNYTAPSVNTVTYDFDDAGNIIKIYINGKPFKEFVYETHKSN